MLFAKRLTVLLLLVIQSISGDLTGYQLIQVSPLLLGEHLQYFANSQNHMKIWECGIKVCFLIHPEVAKKIGLWTKLK
jgi:hypothetical protein